MAPAEDRSRDIAIIGMACIFPKAPDLNAYWRNILKGVCAITEAQPEHWPAVESLNAGASERQRGFAEYLADWHRNAPAKHRQFIATIASRFGICVAPR